MNTTYAFQILNLISVKNARFLNNNYLKRLRGTIKPYIKYNHANIENRNNMVL